MRWTTGNVVMQLWMLLLVSPVAAGEVHLSVAASLREVVNELSDSFAKDHPGTVFIKNYGASGALAKQIESGAPADLFIAASADWMEYLQGKGEVDPATIATFAYNSLVVVGIPGKASELSDLVKLERIAIGSPRSVPAGTYVMAAITKAGLATVLEKKLVIAKDVRECLMYAERGEVDGAFVYKTDALLSRKVAILFTVPPELYPRVSYPLALTSTGVNKSEARAFLGYLQTEAAMAVLKKYGFATK